MANPEHLEILKQGVEVWNQWREESREEHPYLRGTDLGGFDLKEADLWSANLREADLRN